MIRTLRLLWRHRNTPRAELVEINRLLVKAGRRCAYDLNHASSSIWRAARSPDEERFVADSEYYHERAAMWLEVFDPANDGKHYRDKLHDMIDDRDREIKRLTALLEENCVDPVDPDKIPF